jgi:hypothetical protein
VSVDTKFIEKHTAILASWLDAVFPGVYDPHETRFERRFGLRYKQDDMWIRLLDENLRTELSFPCMELKLPLACLAKLLVSDVDVFIVEGEVPLRTLPVSGRAIVLGGEGKAVTLLRDVAWLANLPITYCGDLDVEGFEILSSLRKYFPQIKSILMDSETLSQGETVDGNRSTREPPALLSESERSVYLTCRDNNWRLEQEHIPFQYVQRVLASEQQCTRRC